VVRTNIVGFPSRTSAASRRHDLRTSPVVRRTDGERGHAAKEEERSRRDIPVPDDARPEP
jgi:hypothetical protein